METKAAVQLLAALAQETRLTVFRKLVQAGPEGITPGVLAECLGIANATLSFHLKELTRAGLAVARQQGRSISYSADFSAMQGLLDFLTENCCGGLPCLGESCRTSTSTETES